MGGYECGNYENRNTTCFPSYYDNGLIYDKKTNKCINNTCLNKDRDGNDGNNNDGNNNPVEIENSKVGKNLFISVSPLLIILYIILC